MVNDLTEKWRNPSLDKKNINVVEEEINNNLIKSQVDYIECCCGNKVEIRYLKDLYGSKLYSGKCSECGDLVFVSKPINLCVSCKNEFATCEAKKVEFGNGLGNDNVIRCSGYEKKEDNFNIIHECNDCKKRLDIDKVPLTRYMSNAPHDSYNLLLCDSCAKKRGLNEK
jgi:hypothetical protein